MRKSMMCFRQEDVMLTNMSIRKKIRVLIIAALVGLSLLPIIAVESEHASSLEDGILNGETAFRSSRTLDGIAITAGGQHQASNEIALLERSSEELLESVSRSRI